MGHNSVLSTTLLNAADASVTQNSIWIKTSHEHEIGLIFSYTGSPVGQLFVDACDKISGQPATGQIINGSVSTLSFGSTITIPDATAPHDINITHFNHGNFRVRYVPSSGTGTVTVTAVVKQLGA